MQTKSMDQTNQPWKWARPRERSFDTVVFDVDGVLLDDKVSFRQTIIATVSELSDPENSPAVSLPDIELFKRAGGLNNDWDMAYVLTALVRARAIARARGESWPGFGTLATQSAGRGVSWLNEIVPQSVRPDYEEIKAVFNEFYWGSDLVETKTGHPRVLSTPQPGLVWLERPLVSRDYLTRLMGIGVLRFAVITGRNAQETATGLEILNLDSPFDMVLTAEDGSKPDHSLLERVATALNSNSLLYLGDTRDDVALVQHFVEATGHQAAQAAVVAPLEAWPFWIDSGASLVLSAADLLPVALAQG